MPGQSKKLLQHTDAHLEVTSNEEYSIETAVGIFVVIGLICVGYMTVKLGKVSLFGEDTYRFMPGLPRSPV